jgi:hypothetical protein
MQIIGAIIVLLLVVSLDKFEIDTKKFWKSITYKFLVSSNPRKIILKDTNGLVIINQTLDEFNYDIFIIKKNTGVPSKPTILYDVDLEKPVVVFMYRKGYAIKENKKEVKFLLNTLEKPIIFKNVKKAKKAIKERWKFPGLVRLELRNI